jgi:hypothetical protein
MMASFIRRAFNLKWNTPVPHVSSYLLSTGIRVLNTNIAYLNVLDIG